MHWTLNPSAPCSQQARNANRPGGSSIASELRHFVSPFRRGMKWVLGFQHWQRRANIAQTSPAIRGDGEPVKSACWPTATKFGLAISAWCFCAVWHPMPRTGTGRRRSFRTPVQCGTGCAWPGRTVIKQQCCCLGTLAGKRLAGKANRRSRRSGPCSALGRYPTAAGRPSIQEPVLHVE